MTLERSIFRQAMKTALESSGIVAVGSVFAERVRPTREDQLPAILIEVGGQRHAKRSTSPRSYLITCDATIEVVTQVLSAPFDLCESISEQVMAVMGDWLTLTPAYESLDIDKFSLVIDDKGDQEFASGLITYAATWNEEAPSSANTSLAPLTTIHVDTDLPDQGDEVDRAQTIPIEQ